MSASLMPLGITGYDQFARNIRLASFARYQHITKDTKNTVQPSLILPSRRNAHQWKITLEGLARGPYTVTVSHKT